MTSDLAPELAALEQRFVLAGTDVELPGGTVSLEHPRSADELISEADFALDERLPYWADVWPSSTALAGLVEALDGRGKRALELGCGLGLVTIGAVRAGFDVTATDYYEDALFFARRNVWRATGREPATRLVDWRSFPADLGTFDLVLASDVLYERAYADLVAGAIARSLAPLGVALVADPGRIALLAFITACEERGCATRVRERVAWEHGSARQTITVLEINAPLAP